MQLSLAAIKFRKDREKIAKNSEKDRERRKQISDDLQILEVLRLVSNI